ncbi:uncharacterized protein B0H18DRAFT_1005588 [Fomitopsis serialis]|uniref:uncharacterized protein n=1 Tax=Fomitopsis serialis TaxID=139415 RepID=UPI002008B4EC|nr:uncharacterized protein B0H18DRAFT_1005588 [Neoantrodia serialis]KAH9926789.1 hypothetical protein B0H18DRAFT_1005588 [Neoantrodia serialis]
MALHGAFLIFVGLVNYMYFSATALYVYDYLLTLDREVRYFWGAQPSFYTILFYFYRYPALANTVLEVLSRIDAPWQTVKLRDMQRFQMGLDIVILVSAASMFAALRVFAIYNRNRWLCATVLLIGLVNPGILIVLPFTRSIPSLGTVDGFRACTLALAGSQRSYEKCVWTIFARVAALISDGLVLVLTGLKTSQRRTDVDGVVGIERALKDVLLHDKRTLIRMPRLLCGVNVIGIGTGHLTEFLEIWTLWTAIFTSILLSRLSLDLREVAAAESDGGEVFSRTLRDTPSFARPDSGDSTMLSPIDEYCLDDFRASRQPPECDAAADGWSQPSYKEPSILITQNKCLA